MSGTPGDYSLTEKAVQYAVEKDFHRGTGGYACYNRYWTTRTFDDSITDVLNVSSELIAEVREEITADRAARYALQAAARAKADADFLAKKAAEKAAKEAAEKAARETEELIVKWKTAGKVTLVVGGVLIIGCGIYKLTPKVKEWWCERHPEKPTV